MGDAFIILIRVMISWMYIYSKIFKLYTLNMPFILHQLYFNKAIKHSFHYNYTFTVTILPDFCFLRRNYLISLYRNYLPEMTVLFFSFGAGD